MRAKQVPRINLLMLIGEPMQIRNNLERADLFWNKSTELGIWQNKNQAICGAKMLFEQEMNSQGHNLEEMAADMSGEIFCKARNTVGRGSDGGGGGGLGLVRGWC